MRFFNNQQKIGIGLSFAAIFLLGCGGDVSSSNYNINSSSSSSNQDVSKIVTLMDEYILNSTVTDETNQKAVELGDGKYKFEKETKGLIYASGGFIDINLNNVIDSKDIVFSKVFKAKATSSVITPLTTLLVEDSSIEDKIKTIFNITSEDINSDYVALKNVKLLKLNKALYKVIEEDKLQQFSNSIKNQTLSDETTFYQNCKNVLSSEGSLYIDKLVSFNGNFEEFNSVVQVVSSSSTATQSSVSSSISSFSSSQISSLILSSSSSLVSSSSSSSQNDYSSYNPPIYNGGTVSSSSLSNNTKKITVIDDPIVNATVMIYSSNDLNFTTSLFNTKTDSNGTATFDNNGSETYFTFKSVGGFMNDKAFNGSLFGIAETNATNFSVTPLTSFLFKLSQNSEGTISDKILKSSNTIKKAFPKILNLYTTNADDFIQFRKYIDNNVSIDYLIDSIADDLVDGEIDSKILESIAEVKKNKEAIQQKQQEEFTQLFSPTTTQDTNASTDTIISKVGSQGVALNISFGDKNIVEANRSVVGDIAKAIISKDVPKVAIQKLDKVSKDIANTDSLTVEKFSDDKSISKEKQLELDQKLQNAKQVVEELAKKDINITADDLSKYNFKPIPFILRANSNLSSFIKVDSVKNFKSDMTVAITPYKEVHAIPNVIDINYSKDGYFPIAGADISVKNSNGKFIENPSESEEFSAEIVPFIAIDSIFSPEVKKQVIDGKLDLRIKRLFVSDSKWRDETYPLEANGSKIGGNDPIILNAKLTKNKRFITLEDGAFLTNLAPFVVVAKQKDTNQTVLSKKSVPTQPTAYFEINTTCSCVISSLYYKSSDNELSYARRAIQKSEGVYTLDIPYILLKAESDINSSKKEFILSLDYNNTTKSIYLSLDDIKNSSSTNRYSIDLTQAPQEDIEFELSPILDQVLESNQTVTLPIYVDDSDKNYSYKIEATSSNSNVVKVLSVDSANKTISLQSLSQGEATINYTVSVGDYIETSSFDVTTVEDTDKILITSSALVSPPSAIGLFDKVSLTQDTNKTVVIYAQNIDPIDLNYTILSQPLHGAVVFDSINGEYEYIPNKSYYGQDGFAYKISNSLNAHETHLVSITVEKALDLATNSVSLNSLYIASNSMTLSNSGDFGTIYHAPVEILDNNLSNVAQLYNISFGLDTNLYYGGSKDANISMLVKSKDDNRTILAVLPVLFSKDINGTYSAVTTGKIYGYGKDSKNNQYSIEKSLTTTKNLIVPYSSYITFDTDYIFNQLANDSFSGAKIKSAITNAATKDGAYELYYGLSNGLVFENSSEINVSNMLNVAPSIAKINMIKGNLVIDSNYTQNYISAINISKVLYSNIIEALNKPTTPPPTQSFDLEVKDVKVTKTATGVKIDFEPAIDSSTIGYQIRYAQIDSNQSMVSNSDGNISEVFINDLQTSKEYQFVIDTKYNSTEFYFGWYNVYQFVY